MKKLGKIFVLLLCMISLSPSYSLAQEIEGNKINGSYDTWVKLKNNTRFKGQLLKIHPKKILVQSKNGMVNSIDYTDNIVNIELRKKNSIRKGIFGGALLGGMLGLFTGFVSGDDDPGFLAFSAKEKAILLSIPGTFLGGIIGGIAGSATFKINLNGNSELNSDQIYKLEKYGLSPH